MSATVEVDLTLAEAGALFPPQAPDGYESIPGIKMGEGVFGTVIQVKKLDTGVVYACKRVQFPSIKNAKARHVEIIDLIELETRIMKKIGVCDGVVKIEDVYRHDNKDGSGQFDIIMEICMNGTVEEWVQSCIRGEVMINENRIWAFLKQLSTALACMEGKRIIHCDVKPENILMTEDGDFRLADFGLAAELREGRNAVYSDRGTPVWKPLEVFTEKMWTFKGDVYSMGLCAYYLCTKKIPYGTTTIEMAATRKSESLLRIPSYYSDELWDVIAKCCEPYVDNRFSAIDVLGMVTKTKRP